MRCIRDVEHNYNLKASFIQIVVFFVHLVRCWSYGIVDPLYILSALDYVLLRVNMVSWIKRFIVAVLVHSRWIAVLQNLFEDCNNSKSNISNSPNRTKTAQKSTLFLFFGRTGWIRAYTLKNSSLTLLNTTVPCSMGCLRFAFNQCNSWSFYTKQIIIFMMPSFCGSVTCTAITLLEQKPESTKYLYFLHQNNCLVFLSNVCPSFLINLCFVRQLND